MTYRYSENKWYSIKTYKFWMRFSRLYCHRRIVDGSPTSTPSKITLATQPVTVKRKEKKRNCCHFLAMRQRKVLWKFIDTQWELSLINLWQRIIILLIYFLMSPFEAWMDKGWLCVLKRQFVRSCNRKDLCL